MKHILYVFECFVLSLFLVCCGNNDSHKEIPPVCSFTLTEPANDAYDVALNPTFVWTNAKYSTSYSLFVADNPYFYNQQEFKNLTAESLTLPADLDYSTLYYWKVLALGLNEDQYLYSSVNKFETVAETGKVYKFPWSLIGGSDMNHSNKGDYFEIKFTGSDTYYWISVPEDVTIGVNNYFTFEYQADANSTGCRISFWSDIWGTLYHGLENIPGYVETGINPSDESLWKTYSYDMSTAISKGFTKGIVRFDFGGTGTMLVRNLLIVCELE